MPKVEYTCYAPKTEYSMYSESEAPSTQAVPVYFSSPSLFPFTRVSSALLEYRHFLFFPCLCKIRAGGGCARGTSLAETRSSYQFVWVRAAPRRRTQKTVVKQRPHGRGHVLIDFAFIVSTAQLPFGLSSARAGVGGRRETYHESVKKRRGSVPLPRLSSDWTDLGPTNQLSSAVYTPLLSTCSAAVAVSCPSTRRHECR
jgi:hypothetical protein